MATLPIATAFCARDITKATYGVATDTGRHNRRIFASGRLTRTPFLTGTALNVAIPSAETRSTADSAVIRCEATEKRPLVAVTGRFRFIERFGKWMSDIGATGLVGSSLVGRLVSQGYGVKVLTRNVERAKSILPYPTIQFVASLNWESEICGCDAVVNLAGEPIATRYTDNRTLLTGRRRCDRIGGHPPSRPRSNGQEWRRPVASPEPSMPAPMPHVLAYWSIPQPSVHLTLLE